MRLRMLAPAIRETDALLRRPDVDLVLLPDVAPTSLPRERLYEERWVCVAAPDNPHIGERLDLATLARLPRVCYVSQGMSTHPDLTLEALGAAPGKRIEVEDFLVIPFLVQRSDRVAVLHEQVARRLATAADVCVHPLPAPVGSLGIDMVWNPRTEGDPACRWLRSLLVEIARSRSTEPG
jgi:DNA-binding transcriptional LysR family regulator